jgi:RNA recognition motif-containing protein
MLLTAAAAVHRDQQCILTPLFLLLTAPSLLPPFLLPPSPSDTILREMFGRYGEVGDVYIPRNYANKQSKGFAFVRFIEKSDAEDAVKGLVGVRITQKNYIKDVFLLSFYPVFHDPLVPNLVFSPRTYSN